jgi:hypothetical protein
VTATSRDLAKKLHVGFLLVGDDTDGAWSLLIGRCCPCNTVSLLKRSPKYIPTWWDTTKTDSPTQSGIKPAVADPCWPEIGADGYGEHEDLALAWWRARRIEIGQGTQRLPGI